MSNRKFYSDFNLIKNSFKPYLKEFLSFLSSDKELYSFSKMFNLDISKQILYFFNGIIYFTLLKKNNATNFELLWINKESYFQFLKTVILFLLCTQNDFSKNIFSTSLKGIHNPYSLELIEEIKLETKEMVRKSFHIIYTMCVYLNETMNHYFTTETLYELVYTYLSFVLQNNNIESLKKKWFSKKQNDLLNDERSKQINLCLQLFKKCQNLLKQWFPDKFNELTFIINQTFKEMN